MILPSEFMDQAKKLILEKKEVNLRTAVSRAYYSLYHESITFLETNHRKQLIQKINYLLNSRPTTRTFDKSKINALDKKYIASIMSMHEIVKETYYYIKKPRFASDFKSKRDDRNFADYEIDKNLDSLKAEVIITEIENMTLRLKTNQLR